MSSSSHSTPVSFLPFGSSSSSSSGGGGGGFFSRRKNARRLSVQTQIAASSSSSSSRNDNHGLSVPNQHAGSYGGSKAGSHTSHTSSDKSFGSSSNNKHNSHSGTATVRSASAMAMSDSYMPPPTQPEVVYMPRKIPSMDEVRSRTQSLRTSANRNHHHHQHQPHQHTHTHAQAAPRTAGVNGSSAATAPRPSLNVDFRDPPRSTGHGHRSWQSTTTHPASARSVPTSPQSSDRAADYRMRRYSERPFPTSTGGPSPLPSPYPYAASASNSYNNNNNNTFHQPSHRQDYGLDPSPSDQADYEEDESDDSDANLDPTEVLETFFEHAPEQLPTWIETLLHASPPELPHSEPPKSPPPGPAPPLPRTPDRRDILLLPPGSPSSPSPRRVAHTSHSTPASAISTPMSTSPAHSPRSPPNGYPFSRPPLSLQLPGRLRRRSASTTTSEDHSSPGSGSVPIHQRPLPPVPPSPSGESSIRGRLLRGRRRSATNDVNIPQGIAEESSEPLDTMVELEEDPDSARDSAGVSAREYTASPPPMRYDPIPPPTNSASSGATRPWSVVAHIIPPEERALIGSHRRGSTSSVDSQASDFRPIARGMSASPPPQAFSPSLPSSPFRAPQQAYPVGLTPPPRPPVGLTPPPRPRSSMQGTRSSPNSANTIAPSPMPYSAPGRELSW